MQKLLDYIELPNEADKRIDKLETQMKLLATFFITDIYIFWMIYTHK